MSGRLTILALFVVPLAAGCGEYPRVTVVNQGGEPIGEIVVTLEEGYSYTVGSLDTGGRTTICVEPEGESSPTISYIDGRGERREASGGYLEEGGGYYLTLTIQGDGEVNINSTIGY
ncbi:hypothetical protein KAU45_04125 [bacterium]|nr:hypothetical protein [bacterium]